MNQTNRKNAEKSGKRKTIKWPETVLPPINLWNAPLLAYRTKEKARAHDEKQERQDAPVVSHA